MPVCNIPSTLFYGSIFSELLRIARFTVEINDSMPRASDFVSRMIAQGGNGAAITKQPKKGLSSLPNCFPKVWYNS